MRNIILIFKNIVLRNIPMIALAVLSAVIMVNVFTSVSKSGSLTDSEQIHIGVIDHDSSALSENFKGYLTDSLGMDIISEKDYDLLADRLLNHNISAIIEIPAGMNENAANGNVDELVITTLDDYANAAFIESYLNTYMQSVKLLSDAANGNAETFEKMLSADISSNNVELRASENIDSRQKAQDAYSFSAGFMMMFITGITIFISNTILTDRQTGTYSRMQCSSLKPSEYIIGVGLFGIICCTVTNLLFNLCVFGACKDIPLSPGLAVAVSELFVLFSVGIAILFALKINSQGTLMTVAIGYTTIGSMLGGAWFPISDGLGVVGNIAKIFPQYWFMDILRNMPGDPDFNCVLNICILALSALLVYLISAVIFTKKSS